MWVRATFGQFVGRVGSIESDGLAELRPEGSQDVTLPMEPIPWSQISSIERRGRHTLRGALIGGAIIGGFGAGLGALWGSLGDAGSIAQGTLYGSALGGAVGALAGTILGAPFKGWHRVYSAPSVERTQSDEDE